MRLPSPFILLSGLFISPLPLETVVQFAQAQTQSSTAAVISVTSSEAGLAVFINGKPVGVTPLENLLIPPGEYEIVVRPSRPESWLDADWVQKFKLAAGDSLNVQARLKRGYLINSQPYGAEAFVNDAPQGTTPVVVYVAEDSTVDVQLRLAGYQGFVATIGGGSPRLWNVRLQEDEIQSQEQQLQNSEKNVKRRRFRKLAILSAGVSAASGVTAILLKRRADNYYEDYLSSGDITELNAFYDKSSEYDEYAGAAFAVFQASFALSFYWFLRSTTDF